MSNANTSWGEVCAAVHARVKLYAPAGGTPYFPSVALEIGVDGYAKHDKGRAQIAFRGPGRDSGGEQFEPTLRGAAPAGYRAVCDRIVPVQCRVFAPFAKTNDNTDTSPEQCELLCGLVLAALDDVAHGRAHERNGAEWAGGSTGNDGTTIVLTFTLRITTYAPRFLSAKPTSTAIPAVETANPANEVSGVMVPGGPT
jgi:hypothetical protein